MLLRRITQHLTNQNWFAVAVDFAIVIVGVFIGIQVANWNESRLESQLSTEFTNRLRADIEEEAWDYQYMIEYYRDVMQNAMRVVTHLEGGAKLNDQELIIAAYRASQINLITRRRATFDELVSTGRLDLIEDEVLLNAAVGIYSFTIYETIYESGYNSKYRENFRMHINSEVQLALGAQCGDRSVAPLDYQAIIDSIDYPCDLSVDESLIEQAASTIQADPYFLPFLRLRLVQLQSNLYSLENYYPEISETLKVYRKNK